MCIPRPLRQRFGGVRRKRRCIEPNKMAKPRPGDTSKPALPIPVNATLPGLAKASKDCQACDLWKCGTQTVLVKDLQARA
jgi:hypothetical protein